MKSETPAAPVYQSNPFLLIKPAYEAFKLCWTTVVTLILAAFGAFILLVLVYAIANFVGGGAVVNLILFLIGFPFTFYVIMYAAWAITRSMLSAVRGEKIGFKASLPPSWTDPLKLFVTTFLTGLLIIIGVLCLIVPGIFAMAFWSFAPIVNVDTGEWGWAALVKSREIVRGRLWDMIGALFMTSCINIVSFVPFIGTLAYAVIRILILPYTVVRYETMLELKAQPKWESVPVSPWNYAVLAVGLLVSGYSGVNSYKELQKQSSPVEINQKAY